MTGPGNAAPAGDQGRLPILCLHTATVPPLGADTWVHAKIIQHLDRDTHHLTVGYVDEVDGDHTPTAEILAPITGIERLPVHLGREGRDAGGLARVAALAGDALAAGRSMVRLAQKIRRNDIAVLHTSDRPRDAVACVLLGRLTGARSVVHVHVLYRPWMGRALRWAIESADARIAISEFVAQSLRDGGIDGPVHVALNAIDCRDWSPGQGRDEIRAELGLGADPVVVTACRLFAEKGVGDLIEAMATVRRDVPDARLVVVGQDGTPDQSYRRHLDDLVAEHALGEAVVFTGRRSDVPRLMAAADVFAMPSFEEPFGLVFAEAMAMGLPVIALDNGGTREVVTDLEHGLLSPVGDGEALAANLTAVLRDPELRLKLGAAGREHVLARFDAPRMAADVASIYRTILATTPQSETEEHR